MSLTLTDIFDIVIKFLELIIIPLVIYGFKLINDLKNWQKKTDERLLKLELFFHPLQKAIEEKISVMLKQPTHKTMDDLIDCLADPNKTLSIPELDKLKNILDDEIEKNKLGDLWKIKAVWLSAYLEGMIEWEKYKVERGNKDAILKTGIQSVLPGIFRIFIISFIAHFVGISY